MIQGNNNLSIGSLDIIVPEIHVNENEQRSGTLSWGEMVVDTVKVTKGFLRPGL